MSERDPRLMRRWRPMVVPAAVAQTEMRRHGARLAVAQDGGCTSRTDTCHDIGRRTNRGEKSVGNDCVLAQSCLPTGDDGLASWRTRRIVKPHHKRAT